MARAPARRRPPADVQGAGPSEVAARLAALGCDPLAVMAGIAADAGADARVRLAAAKELAAYIHARPAPRPRAPVPRAPESCADVAGIIARAWGTESDV